MCRSVWLRLICTFVVSQNGNKAFVIKCLHSMMTSISERSRLAGFIVSQAEVCLTWSEKQETCFLVNPLMPVAVYKNT